MQFYICLGLREAAGCGDFRSGDEFEVDADTVERVAVVEIGYIDWSIQRDGKFENGDWVVRFSQQSGDPIGTEDLFAKWSRARQR